ncbi:DUF885 family protein [Gracilimonas mengyeensis]|uniref:DUF885 domain-containing protein n=1 Tax=Gracilimonas mengyeensis TaxID=1302730 RepID=A0A521DDV8_9BACT|nr:DUF885 family protein [Gracilimonas mengyeensis]SMO69994.1 protein of unknown function [Gracilimonas mengyeensis]
MKTFLVLFSFLFVSLPVVAQQPIAEKITMYEADHGALNRKYSVQPSDEYFERFDRFYAGWLTNLESVDFENLSRAEQVDYLLFKNELQRSAYFLEAEEERFAKIEAFIPAKDNAMAFINKRRVGDSMEGKKVANWFSAWTEDISTAQSKLEAHGMLTKREAGFLGEAIEELQRAVEEAYKFYYQYDPDFTWWVEEPFSKWDDSLEEYQEFASNQFDAEKEAVDESGIVGTPIGEEEINRRLSFEMISYTPQELIEIANEQYQWTYNEMLKASRELGYGDDWKAALEYVKTTHVEAGEQPPLVKELAEEAVTFLEERDLVTIPELAKETWRMVMLSPEWQKIAPFFLGGEVVRIAYPTNTMTQEEKLMSMRGNNPHFSKAVVHHELIPGHHLQQFMNQRYETHRRLFRTPFWTEGWALYWEFVLWEKEFPNNPEDRIGMLYWRMHRAARIVFSLNYHLGNWSPQQCIDYLVDKVGHEYANAEAEVRRSFEGNYGPLYQIAYMVGAMQFYSLRMELVDSGMMSEKEFHDTILHNNSIPVAMVKALLTEKELSPEYQSSWKFGDYIQGM